MMQEIQLLGLSGMTLDYLISSEGVLAFASAPGRETPGSAASSNAYSVTVTATDGGSNTPTDVTINVADVNDNDPVLNVAATSTVSATENSTTVATYSVTDDDAGDTVTWFKWR